jgi:hypothetical protein
VPWLWRCTHCWGDIATTITTRRFLGRRPSLYKTVPSWGTESSGLISASCTDDVGAPSGGRVLTSRTDKMYFVQSQCLWSHSSLEYEFPVIFLQKEGLIECYGLGYCILLFHHLLHGLGLLACSSSIITKWPCSVYLVLGKPKSLLPHVECVLLYYYVDILLNVLSSCFSFLISFLLFHVKPLYDFYLTAITPEVELCPVSDIYNRKLKQCPMWGLSRLSINIFLLPSNTIQLIVMMMMMMIMSVVPSGT